MVHASRLGQNLAHELGLEKSEVDTSELWAQHNKKAKELEDCQTKLEEGQREIAALKVDNEQLRMDLAAESFNSDSLKETLKKKEIDNLKLSGENEDLKNVSNKQISTISTLERKLEQKISELDKTVSKLRDLQRNVEKATSDIRDFKKEKN